MMRYVNPINYLWLAAWQGAAGLSASLLYENWLAGILVVSVLMALHVSRRIGSEE